MEINALFLLRGRTVSSSRIEVDQGLVEAFVTFISFLVSECGFKVHGEFPLVEIALPYCVAVGHFNLPFQPSLPCCPSIQQTSGGENWLGI